jgi:hypothetical protein
MSRKFGVEFIVLNRISSACGADYDRFAKANRNTSATKTAPLKHRCVRAKARRFGSKCVYGIPGASYLLAPGIPYARLKPN